MLTVLIATRNGGGTLPRVLASSFAPVLASRAWRRKRSVTTAGNLDPVPISVCIATYRRPESLRRLLEHVSALTPGVGRAQGGA